MSRQASPASSVHMPAAPGTQFPPRRLPTPPQPHAYYGYASIPPQAVPVQNAPRASKIILAATPPYFDGNNKSKWDTWNDALTTYIWAYKKEFVDDETKIIFTISLLGSKDGAPTPASNWVRNWRRRNIDEDVDLPSEYTFKEFCKELGKTFKDQNVQ